MSDQLDHWQPEWTDRTPQIGRRVLRGIFRDLILLAVLLGGFELLLHVVEYGEHRRAGHVTGVGRNEHGYRDRSFSLEKSPGQFRVLTVGDSTTFGTSVRFDETFSKQLQKSLQARDPDREILVANAGEQGGTFRGLLSKMAKHCQRLDPDVVVLSLSASFPRRYWTHRVQSQPARSDASPKAKLAAGIQRVRCALAEAHRWALFHVRTWDFVQHEIRFTCHRLGLVKENLDVPQGYRFAYAFESSRRADDHLQRVKEVYADMEADLLLVRQHLRQRGITLFLAALPTRFMISDLSADNFRRVDKSRIRIDPVEYWQKFACRHKIPFIDVKSRLVSQRRDMIQGLRVWDELYVPQDIVHLNPMGHRIVSEAILDAFRRERALPVRIAMSPEEPQQRR